METERNYTVYAHINRYTNEVYVGQTSQDIEKR